MIILFETGMGSFWIWVLVSLIFGVLCSLLFLWCDKSSKAGYNEKPVNERFIHSAVAFTVVGLVIVFILSLIFAD